MKNPGILEIKTLQGDWSDKDTIMLHACFQLLVNCIEDENLLVGHIDWNQSSEYINAKCVIEELYNWWKNRMKSDIVGSINDFDPGQYEEDNNMLIKLIGVRKYLWT